MYTTNSGIEIHKIYDLINACETILADYGNIPIYTQDYALGEEVQSLYIVIKPKDSKPLRITIV